MKSIVALLALACASGAALAQSDAEILGYTPKKPVQRAAPIDGASKMAPVKPPYTGITRYPAPKATITEAANSGSAKTPRCVYKPVMSDEEIRNCS